MRNIFDYIGHKLVWIVLISMVLLEVITFQSCRKIDPDFEGGSSPLSFSTDTVFFDTVFSTLNPPVRRFTIINKNKKAVNISRIYVEPGSSGHGSNVFKCNVNGDSSSTVRDMIINGFDSIYVFVRMGIPLSNQNLPFLVDASFVCEVNESKQSIVLFAHGQDAHYWKSDKIHKIPYPNPKNPTQIDTQFLPYFIWNPDSTFDVDIDTRKPYVISGYLTVAPGTTLTIPEGTKLHFSTNSGIWVQNDATLIVNGTIANPVVFSSVRMDSEYKAMAGQWGRIWLGGQSKNHYINYAVIENAVAGIWLDSSSNVSTTNPGLTVENTIIRNMSQYGIVSFQNAIVGTNLVVGGCETTLSLQQGGSHKFIHSTFTNYSPKSYSRAFSLEMSDYTLGAHGDKTSYDFNNCNFINSIFYGSNSSQLSFNFSDNTKRPYTFRNCLIKQQNLQNPGELFQACKFNQEPLFTNSSKLDFTIDTIISPTVSSGDPGIIVGVSQYDILGIMRGSHTSQPTIGAYEFVPSAPKR